MTTEVRRRASAADQLALLLTAAQAAGAFTLAVLTLINIGGSGQVAGLGAGLLFFGILFALIGAVALPSAVLLVRGSVGARFALVGIEVLLAITGWVLLPTIGALVAATAVAVVLLVTVLGVVSRRR